MAGGLGATVHGGVLWGGGRAGILWIIALNAFYEGGAEAGGKVGVFAVGFLTAAPAGIAKDVDVGRPDGEAVVAVVIVVGKRVVVFGAGLRGDDCADLLD